MATSVNITAQPDREPVDLNGPLDVEGLLDEWRPFEDHLYARIQRYTPDGKVPILGKIPFDTTTEQIKMAWGGGKFRVQLSAKENFNTGVKAFKRGAIVQQVTMDIEGEPIARLSANLAGALKEAERDDEIPPMRSPAPPGWNPSRPTQPLPTPNVDMNGFGMIGLAFQSMLQSQQMMFERSAAQQAETREIMLAMLQSAKRDGDPIQWIDRILDLRGRLGGEDTSLGQAFVASLPAIGAVLERVVEKISPVSERRTSKAGPQPAKAEARQPKAIEAQPEPAKADPPAETAAPIQADTEPTYSTEQRVALALQVLAVSVTDANMNADAVADVIASMVGDSVAQAMAGDPSIPAQVLDFAPQLADHKASIVAVHEALGALYGDDEPGPADAASHEATSNGVRAPGPVPTGRAAG